MSTKSRYYVQQLEYYEGVTSERVLVASPVKFYDDFIGKTIDTTEWWTLLDTAGGAEAVVADAPNGVMGLALTAAVEAQLAGISFGNQRTFALANDLVAEFRFRFTVLPTIATIACIGLAGDHNAAVDTVAESIWFRFDASGVCTVESDDTAIETSLVATGVTLVANEWMVGRIDLTNPAACQFYINGARVAAATTFNLNTTPALTLQPVIRIGKEAADAGLGSLSLDYVRLWSKRS